MSDENPADTVIEQAAKAICRVHCGRMFVERNGRACNQHQRDGEVAGRALHDADLLADPVDRATVARVRRETAMDWAGYFRTADSTVGWPTLTIARVIELLESGHEPFGCSAAHLDGSEEILKEGDK